MRHNNSHQSKTERMSRHGLVMTELLVSALLLMTTLSFLVTLSFRTGRLWQESRHYRLAVDELSNQMQRLTSLNADEIDAELADLQPSTAIQSALPNPQLAGEKLADEHGARVRLKITWDRPGNARPISLVAWVAPPAEGAEP
jgi:hypothetical protein